MGLSNLPEVNYINYRWRSNTKHDVLLPKFEDDRVNSVGGFVKVKHQFTQFKMADFLWVKLIAPILLFFVDLNVIHMHAKFCVYS